MGPMKNRILCGLLAGALAAGAAAQAPQPRAGAEAKASPPDAEIAALILPGEDTTLSSQMAGKIRSVSIGLGDHVKKGAKLIEFDCSEQQAQLDAADAEYRGARETHLSRLRLQALGAAGELEVTIAAAAAEKARSQVTLRGSQLAYCSVEAPFSGNVARLRVKTAESVPSGHALVDLVNTSSLKAQMFVPGAWIAWLRPGAVVTITVPDTGRSFRARVSKLNSRVDGVSQQLEVEARIERGDGGILPGMVGAAAFERPRKP